MKIRIYIAVIMFAAAGFLPWSSSGGNGKKPRFKVLAFYTAKEDRHISVLSMKRIPGLGRRLLKIILAMIQPMTGVS